MANQSQPPKMTPAVRRVIREMESGAVLHYLPPTFRGGKYWLLLPGGERRDLQYRTANTLRRLRLIEIATRGKHGWNLMTFKLTTAATEKAQ